MIFENQIFHVITKAEIIGNVHMNMIKKNLLAVSVAATLAAAPLANAAWTAPGATPINVVSQGAATTKTAVAASANVIYTLATGEGLTANDTIEIQLTGGAVFSATTPTLTNSAGDLGAGATKPATPLTGGTAGSTSATWRSIDALSTASTTLTLNAASTIFNVTGVTPGSNVDILITLKTSTGVTIGTAQSSLNTTLETTPGLGNEFVFKGVNLTTATVTPATSTAQVATGYIYLEDNATDVLTDAATVSTVTNSAGTSIPGADVAAGNLLYTLTGDFTGIASIAATGVSGSDSAGVATAPAAPGAFTINAGKTAAHATNTAAITAGATLAFADLVLTLDGTSSQAARTFTVASKILGDATWAAHDVQTTTAATIIARNGTFFTTNSTGALNNIKVTDQSGGLPAGGGAILYKAYDAAGNVVAAAAGATALPATVPNNGTTIVPGADIVANYPGAVRIDVTVNSSDANISNVKKSADGVNLTTYRSGAGGSL